MNEEDEIVAKKIINRYLYGHRYDNEYLAYEYPPRHPYFKYMCKKYNSLQDVNNRNIDLLSEHYEYLESINAPEFELDKIDEKIHILENINNYYSINYIWSDDEEEVDFINDYITEKKINLIYTTKREIEFNIIDLEELAKEAFKPSRVNYILSLNPDYEF